MGEISPPLIQLSGDANVGNDCKGYWMTEGTLSSYLCFLDRLVIVAAVDVRCEELLLVGLCGCDSK